MIAGRPRTNLGSAVLDGLGLLGPDGSITPMASPYARDVLDRLIAKDEAQVVNRGEIIEVVAGGVDRPVEKELRFRLEPEWIAVVLVALVHHGDITLTVNGKETLDAGTVERAALTSIDAIAHFQHYGRPRQVPTQTWAIIFEGLGLRSALVKDQLTWDQAVRELLPTVQRELGAVVALQATLAKGMRLWNETVFTDNFRIESEGGAVVGITSAGEMLTTTEIQASLRHYKQLLEELSKYTTAGKLRNLKMHQAEAGNALATRRVVSRGEDLVRLVQGLQPLTTYLAEARANLPDDHAWSHRADEARRSLIDDVRRFGRGEETDRTETVMLRDLETLKRSYIETYAALHRNAVLGPADDDRRRRLYDDPRLKAMNILTGVSLLNTADLEGWKQTIQAIPTCREFHEGAIETSPTCPSCAFRPSQRRNAAPAATIVANLDDRLTTLLANWRQALRTNLNSESARASLANMPNERGPADAFLAQDDDDPTVPAGFAKAATTALRGLQALPIDADDLLEALAAGGLPCTVDEFTRRFETLVKAKMRGHDPRGTRLTLDRTGGVMPLAAD